MTPTHVCLLTCILVTPLFGQYRGDFTFPVHAAVEQGAIEGLYDTQSGIQRYLGIPFARPPIGDLRWKAPQPAERWAGVKETKRFGPRPMQPPIYGDMLFQSDGISEDCLYLNVWTPAKTGDAGLPVLVYFYGGGFVAGDGSEPRYNGASMAAQGIVAVTVNYRLNVFGFLAHPELSAEAPYKASGNYGLLDQQAALAWVRRNIQAFGGDPARVTIAGESAGSISVSYHMASPLSKELIAGAIGESGAGIKPTLSPLPLTEAETIGREFLAKAGIQSVRDARSRSAREIYEIYNRADRFRFPVVLDGHFIPATLPEIFAARQQAQVPLLLGWNSAEIPGAAFMEGRPYEEEAYRERVKEVYPDGWQEVLRLYPHGSVKEIELSATALASDRFIAFSTWRWFDLHRKNSTQPVYRYLYGKLRPPLRDVSLETGLAGGVKKRSGPPPPPAVGAPHACEIEYAMGNLHLVPDFAWTEDDHQVSRTMQSYFANFIKNGNPNGEGLVEWPAAPADAAQPPVLIIDTESRVEPAKDDGRYEFLQTTY